MAEICAEIWLSKPTDVWSRGSGGRLWSYKKTYKSIPGVYIMNGQLRSASSGLLLALCALSFPAAAIDFKWGEVEGSFNSQISIGSSWRLEKQDPQLITPGNKPGIGLASTSTGDAI